MKNVRSNKGLAYAAVMIFVAVCILVASIGANFDLSNMMGAFREKSPTTIMPTQSCVTPVAPHLAELWQKVCIPYSGEKIQQTLSVSVAPLGEQFREKISSAKIVIVVADTENNEETKNDEVKENKGKNQSTDNSQKPEKTDKPAKNEKPTKETICHNKNAGKDGTPSECNAGGGQEK